MKVLKRICIYGAFAICAIGLQAQSISVNLNTQYQKIQGFGGINYPTWIPDLNEDQRKKAFDNGPGDLGLSILRVHVDPDTANFKLELPTASYAFGKGALVFGSPWNAPSGITEVSGGVTRVKYDKYNEYAAHLNAFTDFMNNKGVPLYAISIQNEPDYGDWTRFTADEMLSFMKVNAKTLKTKVMAPESFQFRRAFTDPILNDSTACSHLSIVGGHIYGEGMFDYPLARNKGKEVWMTEHYTESSYSANLWPLALNVATEIDSCMKSNFNAYVWWYIRRFYGLMDDAGNLTKRGYILSQYSKFIRPGAFRVDATVTSAPGIKATAYKTDTSVIIVVVNKNTESTNLNFNIQNSTIASLTKFTTSASKNVINEGLINIVGGNFTASVDGSSITTFSSYAGTAGKSGNVKPIANAGADIEILDNDSNGLEKVILNGSGTDNDGTIKYYSWSCNGTQAAWTPKLEKDYQIGSYTFVLTVTDNDGAVSTDTVLVNIKSLTNTELWFEAECGQSSLKNWTVIADTSASNGIYATVRAEIQSTASASTDPVNHLIFNFNTEEGGLYKLWGRVKTPTANDDSYWVKMDTGNWINWNSIPATTTWKWDDVHDQANTNPVNYTLVPGNHIIYICYREDGALLDKLYLTNTGKTPAGKGADADNCLNNTSPSANAGSDQEIISSVAISVNLDGSASNDPDGSIINYSWIENGKVIASAPKASVNLAEGIHNIFLTVVDSFGGADSDTVKITVRKPGNNLNTLDKVVDIYPNPVENILNIVGAENYNRLIISSVSGQQILNLQLKGNRAEINTSLFNGGVYVVTLIGNNKCEIFKILKR